MISTTKMCEASYEYYMSVPIYDEYTDVFYFPFPDPKLQVCEMISAFSAHLTVFICRIAARFLF